MSSKQDILRSRLYAFYENHRVKGKLFIWQHFKLEGEKKATIYRLMGRIDAGETLSRKNGAVESLFLILRRREIKWVENLIILEGYHYENKQKKSIVTIQRLQICLKK